MSDAFYLFINSSKSFEAYYEPDTVLGVEAGAVSRRVPSIAAHVLSGSWATGKQTKE